MAILTAGIFTACSDQLPLDENILSPVDEAGTVIFAPSITIPEGDGNHLLTSRATYYDGNSQCVFFEWTEKDVVGIFPLVDNATQLKYDCKKVTTTAESANDGVSKAQFKPEDADFAWTAGQQYRAYYPYTPAAADIIAILLDYTNQTQIGKPDMTAYSVGEEKLSVYNESERAASAHLTAKSFLLSEVALAEEAKPLGFKMKHLGGVLRFFLTLPNDINADITEVRLVATKPVFHEKAVLNVLAGTTTVTDEATNNLCLKLDNVHVKYEAGKYDHILAAYMMAYPVALTSNDILGANGKLYIYVKGKDGDDNDLYFRSGAIKKKDIVAGQLTQFSVSPTDKDDPIDLQPITVQQWEDGLNLDNDGKGTGDW